MSDKEGVADIEKDESVWEEISHCLFGRKEILTAYDEITEQNIREVLNQSLIVHEYNRAQIDFLWRYMRGEQPILFKKKTVRPEINNRICENHASEVTEFTSGYFAGEPITYVRRGDRPAAAAAIDSLNNAMAFENRATHDKEMATWMAVCGVGYRMVLPDNGMDLEDEAPFYLDTPDPRTTFVVYNNGFGHKRMMGVRIVFQMRAPSVWDILYCGYTRTHYFEVKNGSLQKWVPHSLGDIPIFEFRLNTAMMGAFEPAVPLLDALNRVQSGRLDGLEQYVQSFLKFKNCELAEGQDVSDIGKLGAIFFKNADGMDSDVSLISQELNQSQTQELVDYLYSQVLTICGLPSTTKGGRSTSDTGSAVFLRDGWSQAELKARGTEMLYKKADKDCLRLILRIMRTKDPDFDLKLGEVEPKFTRRQHDNLQSKVQALTGMLQAGISPEVAIATSGLFNDPQDVYEQSREYMHKWDYVPLAPVEERPENADSEEVNADDQ